MFDDVVVVYKFLGDLMFYVTGDQDENEVRPALLLVVAELIVGEGCWLFSVARDALCP